MPGGDEFTFGGMRMASWREEGRNFAQIPQISVQELKNVRDLEPLNLRKPDEWEGRRDLPAIRCKRTHFR